MRIPSSARSTALAPARRIRRWRVFLAITAAHRWLGLATGGLLLITAATGVGLVFTNDLNLRGHPVIEAGETYADLAPVLAGLAKRYPDYALTSVRTGPRADHAWIVFLRQVETQHRLLGDLDPYRGRLLGVREDHHTAFRWLLDLHYHYKLGRWGAVLGLLVATALLGLAVSGFWIYRGALRDLFRWRVSPGRNPAASVRWLHKWMGLWTLMLSVTWGATGLWFMIEIVPARFAPAGRFLASPPAQLATLPPTGDLVHQGRRIWPEAELHILRLPRADAPVDQPVELRYLFRGHWPWAKFGTLHFDRTTGALVDRRHPFEASAFERFEMSVHALHYGFYGRGFQRAVWAGGGLVMIFLALSGFWLMLRKTPRPRWGGPPSALNPPGGPDGCPIGEKSDRDQVAK